MKDFIRLFRIKHYVKNILIFLPVFFSENVFNIQLLSQSIVGFFVFCLASSIVYIFNDLKDMEKDRAHPRKKYRPLASGVISRKSAYICMVLSIICCLLLMSFLINKKSCWLVIAFILINFCYSMGMKKYPIIDVCLLAIGYLIRVLFGGMIIGTGISGWLYLVVFSGAFYMGLGKRRDEVKYSGDVSREVLSLYTYEFLDKNMYVYMGLSIVFFALWAVNHYQVLMKWTIPFFMLILLKYSLDIEDEIDGDPIEVIIRDKVLMATMIVYAAFVFVVLYFS